jgi:hypothetical protein
MVQLCNSLNAIPPYEAIFSTNLPSRFGLKIFRFFYQIVPQPAPLEIRSGWDEAMAATLTARRLVPARGNGAGPLRPFRGAGLVRFEGPSAASGSYRIDGATP